MAGAVEGSDPDAFPVTIRERAIGDASPLAQPLTQAQQRHVVGTAAEFAAVAEEIEQHLPFGGSSYVMGSRWSRGAR